MVFCTDADCSCAADPRSEAGSDGGRSRKIPRGDSLVRIVKVAGQPKATRNQTCHSGNASDTDPRAIFQPAEIDLALLSTPTKIQRVVASTPRRTIISGL